MSGLENKKIDSLEFDINDPETLKVISKFTDKGTF
jgi:hypothetical protein